MKTALYGGDPNWGRIACAAGYADVDLVPEKLTVVAEGVETEEQLAFLRDQRCDEMQGYLFSPPVPPEQFEELLEENARAAWSLEARSPKSEVLSQKS